MTPRESDTATIVPTTPVDPPHSGRLDPELIAKPVVGTRHNYTRVEVYESRLLQDPTPIGLDKETTTLLWYVDVEGRTIKEMAQEI